MNRREELRLKVRRQIRERQSREPHHLRDPSALGRQMGHDHEFGVAMRGTVIRTGQELLGHESAETTMIFTYALNRSGRGVRSPADRL